MESRGLGQKPSAVNPSQLVGGLSLEPSVQEDLGFERVLCV